MLRSLALAGAFVTSACAAILPPQLGPYHLQPIEVNAPAAINEQMAEYGAEGADNGSYGAFKVTIWQFKDVTGAYAASLDPQNNGFTRVGNYLITCEGKCPKNLAELAEDALPHVSHGSPPTLAGYLPRRNLIPHSARYILGPVGLRAYAPQIPETAAAFDYSTEIQVARYRMPQGEETLAILSYPTPDFARQQLAAFQKLPDMMAKRSGPWVVAVLGPSAAAQGLLKAVNYGGIVESNDTPPAPGLVVTPQTAGRMLLAIISLAGLVLGFCVLSGVAFGLILMTARRFGYSGAEGSLIVLHLSDK